MAFIGVLICLALVETIPSTYGLSGEILSYSDPTNCADNEYFDAHSLMCVSCNGLKNLEPTKDSELLIRISFLTYSDNVTVHTNKTLSFRAVMYM